MTDRAEDGQRSPSRQGHLLTQSRPDVVVRSSRALGVEDGRPVVVVLGMHRSGTSLLSNVLHFLGVDMADMTDHVSPKNAGGFWERPELTAIHDEILAAIDRPIGRASHVLPFPPAWWRRKEVQALKSRLIAYVERELAKSANLWGFKDPRTCRLLPLWWEVFRELKLRPVYVNAVRNPAEASVSMAQKSKARKMSAANGELMWLSYNYDIARFVAAEHPTILVDYADWFSHGGIVAKRLAEELGIGDDLTPEDIAECVTSIVRGEYRHQFDGAEGVASSVPLASMLYQALTDSHSHPDADQRTLRGQLRLMDLFFKSIAPVTDELDATSQAHAALIQEHAQSVQSLVDHKADAANAKVEAANRHAELKATAAAARERADSLRLDHAATIAKLQAARAELDEGKKLGAAAADLAQRDAKLLSEKLDDANLRTRQAQARIADQDEELSALRVEVDRSRSELAEARAAWERLTAESDAEITRLRKRLSRQAADAAAAPAVFEWPVDPSSYKIESELTLAEGSGLAGALTIAGRPDIVPIVEVRVGGRIVLAMACTARPVGNKTAARGEWHFSVPWKSFAPEHAGEEAVVQVAGLGHIIGEAAIPADLRRYHIAPAVLAAELIGGTPAEAEEYHRWILANEPVDEVELARSYNHKSGSDWPRITVVVYGKSGGDAGVAATIASLRAQVYDQWEAICVDAPAAISDVDPRVRSISSDALADFLSGLADDALLSFVEANDRLAPTALIHLALAASKAGDFALIFSDEDRMDAGTGLRALPHFKAEWSADLGLVQDYGSRLALVKRKHVTSLTDLSDAGVYELTLRAALEGPGPVIHVPYILYHRSAAHAKDEGALQSAVRNLLASAPERVKGASVHSLPGHRWSIEWPMPEPAPRVSLIVPTRDRVDLLRVCVEGFLHETDYANLEVLIADNESSEEDTLSYLAKVSTHPRVKVIPCPGPFNFSTINNLAATHATGTLIGLMNNDLKVIDRDWLRRMVTYAVRPDVGIVGAKLLHGDDTIQHAGVTLGIGIASHLYKSFPPDAAGRSGRLVLPQDLSAVTAACLLMRRDVWDEVGGLDEDFPVAYNDIDLCLKVRQAGYRIIWAPEVLVYHLESQSRGKDVTPQKRARLDQDKARLIERWGAQLSRDPFHSPNLSDRHIDARLSFPARTSPPWRGAARPVSEQKA